MHRKIFILEILDTDFSNIKEQNKNTRKPEFHDNYVFPLKYNQ